MQISSQAKIFKRRHYNTSDENFYSAEIFCYHDKKF